MKGFGATLLIVGLIATIIMGFMSVNWWYDYKSNCGDYLKLAADAPSIEKSAEFLNKSVSYMETHGLTSGNSAYFFHTPENDVGIWYNQAKGSLAGLDSLLAQQQRDPKSVTNVDRSNALIKVRETLLDEGKSGVGVTEPKLITWFPSQWGITILWIVCVLLLGIGVLFLYLAFNY